MNNILGYVWGMIPFPLVSGTEETDGEEEGVSGNVALLDR